MNDQQLQFWQEPEDDRGLARWSDPTTSHQAAAQVNVKGLQQVAAEAHLKAGLRGLTGWELEQATGIRHDTITPRLRPLIRKGILVESGQTRPGPTGVAQRVLIHHAYAAIDGWVVIGRAKENNAKNQR